MEGGTVSGGNGAGNVARLNCADGFLLHGHSNYTCTSSGFWFPALGTQCVARIPTCPNQLLNQGIIPGGTITFNATANQSIVPLTVFNCRSRNLRGHI